MRAWNYHRRVVGSLGRSFAYPRFDSVLCNEARVFRPGRSHGVESHLLMPQRGLICALHRELGFEKLQGETQIFDMRGKLRECPGASTESQQSPCQRPLYGEG
jgi:hypothetical protein